MKHVKLFEEMSKAFWIVVTPENPRGDQEVKYFLRDDQALEFYHEATDEAIAMAFYMENEARLDRMANRGDVTGILGLFKKAMRAEDLQRYAETPVLFSSTPEGQPKGIERPGLEEILSMCTAGGEEYAEEEAVESARMLIEIGAPYWLVFPSLEEMKDYFREYTSLSWVPGGEPEMEKKFRSVDIRKGMF